MNKSPDIIILGEFQFPEGCAAALRVLGTGKALREAGFGVLFMGMEKRGRPNDRQADGSYCYQGFPYLSEDDFGDGKIARIKRAVLTHVAGSTTIKRLKMIDTSATKAIIAYHPNSLLLWRLISFCNKRKLALITDCTEWFHPKHLQGGKWGYFYWDLQLRMRWLLPKIGHVIAISKYLDDYYKKRGALTIYLPTLIDLNAPGVVQLSQDKMQHSEDGILRLLFTGSPLRERWDVILAALLELKQVGRSIRLDIYGSSKEQYLSILGSSRKLVDQLGEMVTVHGRVPREEYLLSVSRADFLIMLRDIERWSMACFPTKLPELMLQGLPIISNAHSDLGDFIRDRQEGLIVERPCVSDLVSTLERAVALHREDLLRMKIQARQRVAECFDYRRYAASLREFVNKAASSESGKSE